MVLLLPQALSVVVAPFAAEERTLGVAEIGWLLHDGGH